MVVQIGWNFQNSFSNQFPEDVLSASWHCISFVQINKTFIPEGRGVYIVSVQSNVAANTPPFSNFETPAYIGMSEKLLKRFNNHTSSDKDDALWRRLHNFRKNTRFWYAEFPGYSKDELREIEQALIDIYGSPLNKINSVKTKRTITATSSSNITATLSGD